jgi:hypothetical protein
MKTVKCEVKIVPIENNSCIGYQDYPIIYEEFNEGCQKPMIWDSCLWDRYKFSDGKNFHNGIHFAHIEFREGYGELVADTVILNNVYGSDISEDWIDEFVSKNGSIKEVWVEVDDDGYPIQNSDGTVKIVDYK